MIQTKKLFKENLKAASCWGKLLILPYKSVRPLWHIGKMITIIHVFLYLCLLQSDFAGLFFKSGDFPPYFLNLSRSGDLLWPIE